MTSAMDILAEVNALHCDIEKRKREALNASIKGFDYDRGDKLFINSTMVIPDLLKDRVIQSTMIIRGECILMMGPNKRKPEINVFHFFGVTKPNPLGVIKIGAIS